MAWAEHRRAKLAPSAWMLVDNLADMATCGPPLDSGSVGPASPLASSHLTSSTTPRPGSCVLPPTRPGSCVPLPHAQGHVTPPTATSVSYYPGLASTCVPVMYDPRPNLRTNPVTFTTPVEPFTRAASLPLIINERTANNQLTMGASVSSCNAWHRTCNNFIFVRIFSIILRWSSSHPAGCERRCNQPLAPAPPPPTVSSLWKYYTNESYPNLIHLTRYVNSNQWLEIHEKLIEELASGISNFAEFLLSAVEPGTRSRVVALGREGAGRST